MQTKKIILGAGLLLISGAPYAQYSVRFVVTQLPPYHQAADTLYLAGSFNGWNPKDEAFRLQTADNRNRITVQLPPGDYEYKLTKGSWESVESGNEGFPTGNRRLTVVSDTTVNIAIEHWADHFPKKQRQRTAGKNVHLIDTAFYIPQLNRHRRIWIYLPASYSISRKKYPVLYMQDGQNVFDNATSGFGEWGVDEALDSLGTRFGETIVVAVDHGGAKRINEYAPYDMEKIWQGRRRCLC